MISFRPLSRSDIPLLHRWFNTPHVQTFYSLRDWTEQEVLAKLTPYIERQKPIFGLIAEHDGQPVGYCQYCLVKDFPWPGQNFEKKVIDSAAGLDFFIGEANLLRQGLGQSIIREFLEKVLWPRFQYCIVDPDIRNEASVKLFEKCGFLAHQIINTQDTLGRPANLCLMKAQKGYIQAYVRPLLQQDIQILGDLYFPWSTREKTIEKWTSYLEEQTTGNRLSYIVEYQGKIMGYGHLLPHSEYPHFKNQNIPEINDVWIYEPYRKQGLGTLLISHLEQKAKELGYDQVGIGVGLYRDYGAAQKLYFQLDYTPNGEGITYKHLPVVPGDSYPVDDELILWLIKCLYPTDKVQML